MSASPNALRWDGEPGHYEVYYLTLTDPSTGIGAWIRYTMLAPGAGSNQPATCSLWFLAMDPRRGSKPVHGAKASFAIERLRAQRDPFELRIGEARLSDQGMEGGFDGRSWDLRWTPSGTSYEPVRPIFERLGLAKTVLVLPHADLAVEGSISFDGERIALTGARGGQAHIWGSKHASSWAWVHCNDFATLSGEPVAGAFLEAVSATVSRFGRQLGPNTPVVGQIDGQPFDSTSALRVVSNQSSYALTGWRFEAVDGARKLIAQVDAPRDLLAGVTYHDPDGEPAYCYNTETASLRLDVYARARQVGGWAHRRTLVASGRAHFEYAQRTPIPGVGLLIR